MNFKKIFLSFIVTVIIVGVFFLILNSGNKVPKIDNKIHLVSSNFASYDFLRAIVGDNDKVELTFLIGPGKEAHSYDPTAQDLVKIQNADLFVYIGGESEKWADKVMDTININKTKVIKISDFVYKMDEKEVDGAEEEEEEYETEGAFDDHIWTSPSNAVKMIDTLEKAMGELDYKNKEKYKQNADDYITKIDEVDAKIQEIVDKKVRDRLVFGDRMPMQYFMDYYGLKASAAFSGCSTETEPSAATIAYLEKRVKEDKIPVIFYIELNNGRVAKTIADETEGTEALQIQTLHNVSLDDFNNGETWVSLMERNVEVLKKALL